MWGIKMFLNGTETANHHFQMSHKSRKGYAIVGSAGGELPLDRSVLLLIQE